MIYSESIFLDPFKRYIHIRRYFNILSDDMILSYINDFKPFHKSLKDIDKYYDRLRKKFSRALKRVNLIMQYTYVYFITFTFSDDFLKNGINLFKKYRNSELKKYCYLGNIDYGSNTNRMHYHFIVGSSIPITKDILNYNLGFLDIRSCNNNSKALTNYICNLTKHSFKSTNKLIYSRIIK